MLIMNLSDKLNQKLNKRKEEKAFRVLSDFNGINGNKSYWIDFFSNDYLGLARIEFEGSGGQGATGSRLLSGNTRYAEDLEQKLAVFFDAKAGLLFNSGFDANIGVFSTLPQRGDTIIFDELCHASIRDGIKLSNAHSFSFKHNDVEHLAQKLATAKGDIYVAIESIYSMDGDKAKLQEIATICEHYNAKLIVDEAHSGGLYGKEGRGVVSELGMEASVYIKLITFGKAYGRHGSIVLCDENTKDYLINFCRSFIYTTALPTHSLNQIEKVVDLSKMMGNMRTNLFDLVAHFKKIAKEVNVNLIQSDSPIQSVLVVGNEKAKALEKHLQDKGFGIKAILSPTVKKGKERLRICLHGYNMKNQVNDLLTSIGHFTQNNH